MASIHERFEISVPAERVYEALSQPERIVGTRGRMQLTVSACPLPPWTTARRAQATSYDQEVTERVAAAAHRVAFARWALYEQRGCLFAGPRSTLVIVHVKDSIPSKAARGAEELQSVDAAMKSLSRPGGGAGREGSGGIRRAHTQ